MISLRTGLTILILCAGLAGCSRPASNVTPAQGAGSAAAVPAPAAAHATPPESSATQAQTVTGRVVETMNAANYTYVRVQTGSGELWAATSQFPVAVGDRVTVPLESPMQNFHSQSLKRDFPLIYFTSSIAREGDSAASGNPHGGAVPSQATTVTEPVPPPQGGSTIAKVWAERDTLGGKKVTVRGKVVKYNAGIMGRNWIHIQDGSGKAADGSNDLTLTTNDAANLGDVITATGTVTLNKDFGAGYRYTVMLENATIAAK